MPINLESTGRRFESIFLTDAGYPFPAELVPLDEGAIYANDFVAPRQIIRVRQDSPVGSGTLFKHPSGSLYLMADHDVGFEHGDRLYRTHVTFRMSNQLAWTRETQVVDALTQLKKSTGSASLGSIWVLLEQNGREQADGSFRIKEDVLRLVTNANLQLNDRVGEYMVRRIITTLGITLAEVQ